MTRERSGSVLAGAGIALLAAVGLLVVPKAGFARDFEESLARVDDALRKNPSHVLENALQSCQGRRSFAIQLFQVGEVARAERSLRYCFDLLEIPENPPKTVTAAEKRSMEEMQAQAAREVERALALTPNLENGLAIYRECSGCHMPEGWGLQNGSVPQIAGQHRNVVIKQLADVRAGNRDTLLMLPYASVEAIGGTQAVADVAGYIDTLEISVETGKGPGKDLTLGARIYREKCAACHGETGEGNEDKFVPRIQAQHYNYLVRQFERIRDGERRNANPDMVAQIQGFEDRDIHAVMDYVSRLEPPEAMQAPPGWHNPDFAR